MTEQPPKNRFPRLHRDGTVSFWSYLQQEWVERSFFVPAEEFESMDPYDQRRVRKHLGEEVEPVAEESGSGEDCERKQVEEPSA